MEVFKRVCGEKEEKKFNELWEKLDELRRKERDEECGRGEVEGEEGGIGVGGLDDEGGRMRRR